MRDSTCSPESIGLFIPQNPLKLYALLVVSTISVPFIVPFNESLRFVHVLVESNKMLSCMDCIPYEPLNWAYTVWYPFTPLMFQAVHVVYPVRVDRAVPLLENLISVAPCMSAFRSTPVTAVDRALSLIVNVLIGIPIEKIVKWFA